MAAPLIRHLAIARRHVPLDRADEYLIAWSAARAAVEAIGGQAWIFRGASHEDRFMEFVEWLDPLENPLADDGVAEAMSELNAFAVAAQAEEWEEAT